MNHTSNFFAAAAQPEYKPEIDPPLQPTPGIPQPGDPPVGEPPVHDPRPSQPGPTPSTPRDPGR